MTPKELSQYLRILLEEANKRQRERVTTREYEVLVAPNKAVRVEAKIFKGTFLN